MRVSLAIGFRYPSRMTSEELVGRITIATPPLILLDKPAGLPGSCRAEERFRRNGDGSVPLTSLFDALRFGLPRRPELAHRLDRETSGCLVLGRNRAALKARFVVPIRRVAEPIGRSSRVALSKGRRDRPGPRPPRPVARLVDESRSKGVTAVTRWQVIGRAGAPGRHGAHRARALEPVTGRTHQLRVHCAAMGWPILGDAIYGEAPRSAEPALHLHARALELPLCRSAIPSPPCAPSACAGQSPLAGSRRPRARDAHGMEPAFPPALRTGSSGRLKR